MMTLVAIPTLAQMEPGMMAAQGIVLVLVGSNLGCASTGSPVAMALLLTRGHCSLSMVEALHVLNRGAACVQPPGGGHAGTRSFPLGCGPTVSAVETAPRPMPNRFSTMSALPLAVGHGCMSLDSTPVLFSGAS
jgi:hypothetical protein